MKPINVLAAILLPVLAQPTPTANGGAEWKEVLPPLSLEFPRDHGSHPEYRTEWWYFTGRLESEAGEPFGYQFTIFRQGFIAGKPAEGEPDLTPRHILAGHFAIADIGAGEFRHADRIRRAGAGYAEARENRLHTWIGDWETEQLEDGSIRMIAADREAEIAIDFTLAPVKPYVLQGIGGYSQKGDDPGNASSYVTNPRMKTVGTLVSGGRKHRVSGESWFDHEWGTSQLGEDVEGWDWFGLHLDDGRELMVYYLRREDGGPAAHSSGTLIARDGSTKRLTLEDYTLEPLSTWTSPETGIAYPLEWRIRIPGADIDITSTPPLEGCEMRTEESTGITYWEGPVELNGSVTGRGYMELTGYADSMNARL